MSLRQLSESRNVPLSYLNKMASMASWHDQRAEMQGKGREEAATMVMAMAQERMSAMTTPSAVTADQQLTRSKLTGDKLYALFQVAVSSLEAGDLRQMRNAIDAWVALDEHMRTVHGLDIERERPLVNIQVMSALPDFLNVAAADPVPLVALA